MALGPLISFWICSSTRLMIHLLGTPQCSSLRHSCWQHLPGHTSAAQGGRAAYTCQFLPYLWQGHKDGPCLIEGVGIIAAPESCIAGHGALGPDVGLQAVELSALIAHLHPSLTHMDGDTRGFLQWPQIPLTMVVPIGEVCRGSLTADTLRVSSNITNLLSTCIFLKPLTLLCNNSTKEISAIKIHFHPMAPNRNSSQNPICGQWFQSCCCAPLIL